MLPNPSGGKYGPDSGPPNLYPKEYEHLRPTVSQPFVNFSFIQPSPSSYNPLSIISPSNSTRLTKQTEHKQLLNPPRKKQHGYLRPPNTVRPRLGDEKESCRRGLCCQCVGEGRKWFHETITAICYRSYSFHSSYPINYSPFQILSLHYQQSFTSIKL